ncbi:DUF883 family protein [Paragemmobacter straminiformis]|uniref:Membrane-anchored ribosome-binding protein, inhibits growth in stationary phase, ElaB/YqjD/DUF883 family n=1 Tax=Paragemmobacter straminiformis TaxID=2045119 RepID=A0A842ICS5_9RHOB|nr:hypothetical protein [Gemmobacter straminiformis]MBC2836894.1 hypothetical protein [Gemmobacter straminiformis]
MNKDDGKADRAEAVPDIEQQIRQLREDVAALAKSLQGYGARVADGVKARAQDASGDAVAESLKAVRELRGEVEAMQARLEGDVRAHPLAWLVGALGIGVLLGLIFSHRDHGSNRG